ncbi:MULTISPECIES: non-ribosomal peptide synthetase [Planktothrix]|jgi:microcystin synthetase protein McyC|uniref:McyC protein n=39 Tax=Planktothrix TaxID=54304 RepID=A0A4P5ZQ44_PLAAG|nr:MULTISPECIES: non-ribosomal peptide synthetase [Planktothrix]CAD5966232.1 Tyrocidine synthase 3 [Planktothrix rubescens]CAC5343228.1 non ribosomal peptide synthetase, involved in microcystin biosynthesis [Planktothrix rubescens NIVA-CYA 18]CAD5977891.1 Tyrocidine synthase 3 [Planktothrix rubescens NIVA-CYA 18]CAQ48247.1 McyC protein [Planktothrix prolifica NIVA-CYA 98]GDZ95482.1 McyC protein [Planktothrix agardhii CCAP 1459/11A]
MSNLQQSNSIAPLAKQQYYDVSHGQRRLWILHHINEYSSAYNIRLAIRIQGNLNVTILTKSFQEIVNRHEILRTTFASIAGNIQQIVHENIAKEQLVIFRDLRGQKDAEILADTLIQESANSRFDLDKLPLMRVLLVQIKSEEFLFGLTIHHIIGDATSLDIIFKEFVTLYFADIQQKNALLPPLELQYKDYTAWQNQWLESEEVREQHNYWCDVFAEHPPILNLPTDFPRPQLKSSQAASYTYNFSQSLSEQLRSFAAKNQTTLFITLLTLFKILLYRYTGQRDLVIGIPISGRNHPDLENQIGFYVNTLALRTLLPESGTFKQVLTEVTNTCIDAYEYSDYPFDKLVSALNLERDLLRNPLFDVMFSLLSKESKTVMEIPEIEHQEYPLKPRTAQFDLTWSFFEDGNNLRLAIEYEPDLFRPETIARMGGHFLQIIQTVIENPNIQLSQINLLTPEERDQLLIDWNNTQAEYPQDKCLHQLFEEQVKLNPNAIAVIFEDQKLTYQQLNKQANQLAHYLQEKGVNKEVLVGIFIERSLEMIIGILGILKAGGAYIPLDPNYPAERLTYMISDSRCSILLTQQSLVQFLPPNQAELLCLDRDWQSIANYSQENPINAVTSDNLAYVIYTSGSTGKPKGVMNLHRGICNNLWRLIDAYPLTLEDRILQLTPFSFDPSVWEIFWSLISGTTLVVAKPEGHKDIAYLINLIASEQVTNIGFVPSMLRVFLQQPNLESCRCLKRIFCGGEALSYELNQLFFERLNCELHNLYGPTETAVDATYFQCKPQSNYQIIPIGRPIANTQIYILDQYLQPVPIGVAGELHIGGVPLARGYLNQPELTAKNFISNPFGNGKLYKTGDLARYLPDGNIEYLGRIDNQVKLRGLRIELGEIESLLATHPQVEQTVVILPKDITENQSLVAYIVGKNLSVNPRELRSFLQAKLPVYMIPSAFVILSEFPLNPSGKIDIKKLPKPDQRSIVESPYLAPGNQTEVILVNIWQQLLRISKIGVNDNFFDLGGHSLQAMNLMALIYQETEIEIPLSIIYEKPTVKELSEYIIYAKEMNIQPKERPYVVFNKQQKKAVFLFPPALGFATAYTNLADYLTDYTIYTFRYIADELMLEQYAELIDHLSPDQDLKLMGHSAGGFLAMLIAKKLESRDRVVSDIILLDTYRGGSEAKKADMSEIKAGVDGFLLNPKRQELRRYFLENQKLRDRTYNQVWEYFNFLWNSDLKNLQINGTIHLIRAEGNYDVEDDWIQATKGQRINYYASGVHREMIDPPYLQKNATIINSILNMGLEGLKN